MVSLVVLLGVGAVAHNGDDLSVLKGNTTQTTQVASISGFGLVCAEQATPPGKSQNLYNTLKINPFDLDCALNLSVKSLRGARVELVVSAPCHKNKIITIKHAGLRFNEVVDGKGMITIIIPVLSDPATIEVSFADGTSKSISAPAIDLSSLR